MTSAGTPIPLADPVTRHMRQEFAHLRQGHTVGQALDELRRKPPPGRIVYFYVLDEEGRLVGVVPTRRLLLSLPEMPVGDIMVRVVLSIPETATVLEACEFFTLYRLLAFPVVDADRRVLGIVDVELYTTELSNLDTHERSDDVFQLVGVHLDEVQQASPARAFRGRFPWLLCNIAGGLLAALLSSAYQHELSWREAVLALFVPVVLALAESVSIQSVSLALRVLQGRRSTWSLLRRKARQEMVTGLFLGAGCGLLVGVVALVWLGHPGVALCLTAGILGGVTGAAVLGFSIPLLLHLLQRDPQVAAGPIALAIADLLTLLLYFNLARWLLVG